MYFNNGEFIEFYTSRLVDCDEIREIVSRLEMVTMGCKVVGVCDIQFTSVYVCVCVHTANLLLCIQ